MVPLFLRDQGKKLEEVATLSEEETAYALSPMEVKQEACDAGSFLNLKYPRDIAVIRDTYQKQSVFDTSGPNDRLLRPILRRPSEVAVSDGLDSLPGYSGDISALDQEARLFGVLDRLRVQLLR